MKLSKQELFNKAYLGIVRQGCFAYDTEAHQCLYRTKDELRCAVGHIMMGIVDDEHILWESTDGVRGITDKFYEDLPWVEEDINLLNDLQIAHDESRDIERFQKVAQEIAEGYRLEIPNA